MLPHNKIQPFAVRLRRLFCKRVINCHKLHSCFPDRFLHFLLLIGPYHDSVQIPRENPGRILNRFAAANLKIP